MTKLTVNNCNLCNSAGEELLWQDEFCRIISIADEHYPGFCRVVLQEHVREMTDLEPPHRERLMRAVFATETALRELMKPDKINMASMGNGTPHLHWHVFPRFTDDRHFPHPIWGEVTHPAAKPRDTPDARALSALLKRLLG